MRLSAVAGLTGVAALLLVALISLNPGGGPAASAGSAGGLGGTVGQGTGPAVIVRRPATVTYVVSATAAATVSYGPTGSDFNGQAPVRVTKRVGSAVYYGITALLHAGGSVECEILLGGTVVSRSVATGSYNVVSCQARRNPGTDAWQGAPSR